VNRSQFEHTIRAAADIAHDDLVVIGSQAILASYPDPPEALVRSMDLDMFPLNHPERSDWIDGAMGEGSQFNTTYAFYAHGLGPESLTAPAGWQDRVVRIELPAIRPRDGTVVALCLSPGDLVLAKLAAGRPRDLEFAEHALREGLVDGEQLLLGAELLPNSHRNETRARVEGLIAKVSR